MPPPDQPTPPGGTPAPPPPPTPPLLPHVRHGWSCGGLMLLGILFVVVAIWLAIEITTYRWQQKAYTESGMTDDGIGELKEWLAQPAGFPKETWQRPLQTPDEFVKLHTTYFASALRLNRRFEEAHTAAATTAPVTLAEMEDFADVTEAIVEHKDYTLVPYRVNHYPINPDIWYSARTALLRYTALVHESTTVTTAIRTADLRVLRLQLALLKTAPEDSKPHKIEDILPRGVWELACKHRNDPEFLKSLLDLLHSYRDAALISSLACKPFNTAITRFMLHDGYIGRPPITNGDHAHLRIVTPLYNHWVLAHAQSTHPLVRTKGYPASITKRLTPAESETLKNFSDFDLPQFRKTVHDLAAAYNTEELIYYHSANKYNDTTARFYTRDYDFVMIALAQRVMHLRGQPPATTLKEMVPVYLPKLLHDPHSPPGTPYRYSAERQSFASHQDGGHIVYLTNIFTWPDGNDNDQRTTPLNGETK